MKVLFLADPNPQGQDQFADALLHGFVRVCGQSNVDDFFHFARHRGGPDYLQEWPIFLGALAYKDVNPLGLPRSEQSPSFYDVQIATMRFITHAMLDKELMPVLDGLSPERLIIIASEDGYQEPPELKRKPRLVVHRPGNGWEGYKCLSLHISVPHEWIEYHKSRRAPYIVVDEEAEADDIDESMSAFSGGMRLRAIGPFSVYAAMNDNHPLRREVAQALADARIPGSLVRFGSGSGYMIDGCEGTVGAGQFIREIEAAQCVVNVRGANVDTMCISQTLALRKCLITTDFGASDRYIDGSHVLYYTTADEALLQVTRVLANAKERTFIGSHGFVMHGLYDTVECQAARILVEAGFM